MLKRMRMLAGRSCCLCMSTIRSARRDDTTEAGRDQKPCEVIVALCEEVNGSQMCNEVSNGPNDDVWCFAARLEGHGQLIEPLRQILLKLANLGVFDCVCHRVLAARLSTLDRVNISADLAEHLYNPCMSVEGGHNRDAPLRHR